VFLGIQKSTSHVNTKQDWNNSKTIQYLELGQTLKYIVGHVSDRVPL